MAKGAVVCKKCNGTGYLRMYAHVDNGKCFGCMGTGYLNESWKKRETELLQWVADLEVLEHAATVETEVAALLRKKFITQENADVVLQALESRKTNLPTIAEREDRRNAARRERSALRRGAMQ